MTPRDITLSCLARATAERLGLDELVVKRCRAASTSSHEQPGFLVVNGQLPDGRVLRMHCRHDQPAHIVSLRIA